MLRVTTFAGLLAGLIAVMSSQRAAAADRLPAEVQGLIIKAAGPIKLDGKLDEWAGAFCTPVHYNHRFLTERAAQFFYLWDEEALYIGLRTLDTKTANPGGPRSIQDGDAVEFYLDTRPRPAFRGKDWTTGAIHLFYSGFDGKTLAPRWVIRGGIATSDVQLAGVEVNATADGTTTEVEFKLPWKNFPDFTPRPGAILALDAELCSGDGDKRTDRTFAYGSPLSVQQPASQAAVSLADALTPDAFPQVGPAMFPMWVDTPWVQPDRARVTATVAIPPGFVNQIAQVEVRLHDADGTIIRTIPARVESFGPPRDPFHRALASWSIDDFAPNTYFATAKVTSRDGRTLATVAPRMNAEANMTGR